MAPVQAMDLDEGEGEGEGTGDGSEMKVMEKEKVMDLMMEPVKEMGDDEDDGRGWK